MNKHFNIIVTLDSGYLYPLSVMLKSLVVNNPDIIFEVYILHQSLTKDHIDYVTSLVGKERLNLHPVFVDDEKINSFPTSRRYPKEMYFRLFCASYLPEEVDRILYLDPDIVTINPIDELYNMPFDDNLFMACTHVSKQGQIINGLRLKIDRFTPYFNSGVILINLIGLRQFNNDNLIYEYIEKNRNRLLLPDQDVFTAIYGKKTKLIDSLKYNLGDRYITFYDLFTSKSEKITLDIIKKNTVIIHFYGKNKPWKRNYRGILNQFYHEYANMIEKRED